MSAIVVAALMATPIANALPIIDFSISAGINHSRTDSWWRANAPDTTSPSTYTATEPRATVNASIGSLLGIEAGWSKLGSDAATVTIPPPPIVDGQPMVATTGESASALWLAYAPSVRFSDFELTGKLGAARLHRKIALGGLSIGSPSDTEVFYGISGTYWFADVVGFRLDAERIGSDVAQAGVSLTIGF